MVNRKTAIFIRKSHRYLGIFLGIQFLLWTISGLYFSWTNIDEIHGDHFLKDYQPQKHTNLLGLDSLMPSVEVQSLALRSIDKQAYYWVNEKVLINAENGALKTQITEQEAIAVASERMRDDLKIASVDLLTEVDKQHEYRGGLLPVYAVKYEHPEVLVAYVSAPDGAFQKVRYRAWRWFDFLWMTHIMDYDERDDINNLLLRSFSILGLITVMSGFLLWFTSSPTVRRFTKKTKK